MSTDCWLTTWLYAPLAQAPDLDVEALASAMVPAITAYRAWCEADGVSELLQFARRISRDADAAEDAVSETFLDVRSRLSSCVARAAAGRSLPSFQTVAAVTRYHCIQVRLRIQGRWGHARPMVSLQDVELSCAPTIEESVDARQRALPLRFALCWTLTDVRSRAAHKDTDWWWAMLRHGLNIASHGELGGSRNDPTEITDRLRLRMAVADGMRPWLKRWAAEQTGWSDLAVAIPDTRPDTSAIPEVLPQLRASLAEAIRSLPLSEAEAAGLEAVLVRGATVRTHLRCFSGPDPRARMVSLAGSVGAAIAA